MRPGDPCSACIDGTMRVYSVHRSAGTNRAVRYLRCSVCGSTGKQQVAQEKLRVVARRVANASGEKVAIGVILPTSVEGTLPQFGTLRERDSSMSEFMITLPKLAAKLEVDEPTLLRFVRDGVVPQPVIIGGFARFRADELRSWAEAGCPQCEPCGHRVLNRVRRAMIDEGDIAFEASMQRLSVMLDNATPAMLARVESLLND